MEIFHYVIKPNLIDQTAKLRYLCAYVLNVAVKNTMARKKIENLSFEESLSELETIVQNLEHGELSLDDSMTLFERGLNLSQISQSKLQDAEQKIQILLDKNNSEQKLTPFELTQDND